MVNLLNVINYRQSYKNLLNSRKGDLKINYKNKTQNNYKICTHKSPAKLWLTLLKRGLG